MHSQHFTVVEHTEDSSPDSSEEQDETDGAPVFVLGVLQSVGSDDDEGYGIPDVSDHVSEEQRQEYGDQEGRVDLLVLRDVDHAGRILEFADDYSVVLFRRNVLETRLRVLGIFEFPSAGLLELHIDVVPELLLEVGLDGVHFLCRYPCVHDVCVLAHRDPEGNGSLLDLDGQLFVASFQEGHVFRFESFKRLVLRLEGLGRLGDLRVYLLARLLRGHLVGVLGNGQLDEAALVKGVDGLALPGSLDEDGHDTALFLVEAGEDLGVVDLDGRGIGYGCTDENRHRLVPAVEVKRQRQFLQNLKSLLFRV